MNRKFVLILVSSLLIIIVLFAAYFLVNIKRMTLVYVDPADVAGSVGQDFTISVDVSDVANLYAWEFKLGWNTTVLDLANVTEGSFLKNTESTFFSYGLNETFGHVVVDCTFTGEVPGVDGSGVLVSIRFHVENTGSCELTLYDTKLVDVSEQMIAHTAKGGRFSAES